MYFDYIMEYDYSAKTVNFTWYNDELGWKFTHTETLSDTDGIDTGLGALG